MDKIPPNVLEKIPDSVKIHLRNLEAQLNQVPQLQMVEEKIKVPKLFLVLGVGLLFVIFLMCDLGGEILSNLTGLIYPALESFKTVEGGSVEQQRFWFSYWVIFGLLNSIEFIAPSEVIPFYFVFRTAFLIWLFNPFTMGANLIYQHAIKKLLPKSDREVSDVKKDS